MTILIDSRVGSRELAALIKAPHRLCQLSYGDVSWLGNGPDGPHTASIGVERKTLSDLIQSMESGRLANHQLIGMTNSYHYSYIVVEGRWRTGPGGILQIPIKGGKWIPFKLGSSRRFTSATVDNFINSLMCMSNAMVVFTRSLRGTAGWISNVYRWWTNKKWEQHRACAGKSVQQTITGMRRKAPLAVRFAMEIRGVGPKRALDLGRVFGSVEDLYLATVEDLMKVEGVGRTTAEGIYNEIRAVDGGGG